MFVWKESRKFAAVVKTRIMAELVLDNKTYQAYVNIAEQNNISVTDAIREALLLLKQHFRKSTKSSLRKHLEERIEELRSLSSNWDYLGSPAISASACEDTFLQGLAIFPNSNGYVLMKWRTNKGEACLSILSDRLVYDIIYVGNEKSGILSLSDTDIFIKKIELMYLCREWPLLIKSI